MSDDHGSDGSSQPPRGLAALAYSGIVVVGLAAVTLAGVAGAADSAPALGALKPLTHLAGNGVPPHSSRTASRKLARRLIKDVKLPPGTVQIHFAKLPPALRNGSGILSGDKVDVFKLYWDKAPLSRSFAFIEKAHLKGWSGSCCGAVSKTVNGKTVYFARDASYYLRRLPAGDNSIEMDVTAVPHHGHTWIRVDLAVTWYPRRSAAEHLIASHFRSVTASLYRTNQKPHQVTRTFRQRAIIDRLTKVLNSAEAAPRGGIVNCPLITSWYSLTFHPVGHQASVLVSPTGCVSIGIKVGGHQQPALVNSANVEGIILHLLHLRLEHLVPGSHPIPHPVKH
ncbi:MAG TPA: hypothetical protein VFI65_04285 [Streptosporangiaceae bacterium]|nr:hypothetical protein [Streptosporangiaceae bacterium]